MIAGNGRMRATINKLREEAASCKACDLWKRASGCGSDER